MSARRAPSTLQIHLPDRWPDPGALGEPRVRWSRRDGGRIDAGVSAVREIPTADRVTVVVPCARVTFARALLPRGSAAKLARLAAFAIEDKIVPAPEDVHVAVLDELATGERLVAVLDKAWLGLALEELEAQGARPDRLVAESQLVSHAPDTWTVAWFGDGGFATLGSPEALALDASIDGRPPLALKLAQDERTARGEGAARVRVLLAPDAPAPDVEKWSQSLHVPVTLDGRWTPESIDAAGIGTTDLLAGGSTADALPGDLLPRLKPAALVLAAVLGVHALLTVGDWMRLRYQSGALQARMEADFRAVFPEAQAVVDPRLQMTRNLADLRRAAGEPDAADAIPLLARVSPALRAANARAQSLKYERGQLELELAVAPGEAPEALAARLRSPGIAVRVEKIAAGAHDSIATVRFAAGER